MYFGTADFSKSIPQQTEVIEEIKDEQVRGPLTLPKKVPYLIVGGGTASWSAFRAIKEKQPNAKVHSNLVNLPITKVFNLKHIGSYCLK